MSTVYIKPEGITEDRVLLIPNTSGSLVPPGSLLMFGGLAAPAGYLLCDGAAVSRSEYGVLFGVIGTAYGAGNGSTTFNLPDLRSRGPLGAGAGVGLTSRLLGVSGGAETVTLDGTMLPSHTHTGTTASDGSHAHTVTDPGHTHTGTTATAGSHAHTINDPGHSHTQNTINDDFNNSGANPPGFSADSAGSRTWANINASGTGITVNANGDHTHTFTSDSSNTGVGMNASGLHTHTFTSDATGGGGSHPNMQPYLTVNFIIKT